MDRPVYMDYAAATPLDPRVVKVMMDCLTLEGSFANPSSKDHVFGWEAAEAVENAREQVANLVGCSPLEITFTSGATESNNLAVIGLARGLRHKGDPRRHIVTSMVEHKAVLEGCEYLEKYEGYTVSYIKPHQDGSIDPELLASYLTEDTFLVSICHGNSVLGTVNDIHALALLCKDKGIYFHTDCAQTAGWEKTDFDHSAISMASLTPEKIYGPKGVGALYIKREANVPVEALIYGGGQECGIRGGTENVPGIVGLGAAVKRAFASMEERTGKEKEMRDYLIGRVLEEIPYTRLNGHPTDRLPGNTNFSFRFIEGESLLIRLDMKGICGSSGSACTSGSLDPSHVLLAIGLPHEIAHGSLRLTLNEEITREDIDYVVESLKEIVEGLRRMSPLYEDFMKKQAGRASE